MDFLQVFPSGSRKKKAYTRASVFILIRRRQSIFQARSSGVYY